MKLVTLIIFFGMIKKKSNASITHNVLKMFVTLQFKSRDIVSNALLLVLQY